MEKEKLKLTQQEQTDTILELVKLEKRKELFLWIIFSLLLVTIFVGLYYQDIINLWNWLLK